MLRFEALALSIANVNGGFSDPTSKAFTLCNPLMLKCYRPEKKTDADNYRIFTTVMGGFKAGVAELQARCSGKNHRLSSENTLRDLLALYGFKTDMAVRKIVLFCQKSLNDESVSASTKLAWFREEVKENQ